MVRSRIRQLLHTDGSDHTVALLPAEYDRVKESTLRKRDIILEHIHKLNPEVRELTESMLASMLQAGAGAFHHHTVERQDQPYDPNKPDKDLGIATDLSEERKTKIRVGASAVLRALIAASTFSTALPASIAFAATLASANLATSTLAQALQPITPRSVFTAS